jgi:hypothetical protein
MTEQVRKLFPVGCRVKFLYPGLDRCGRNRCLRLQGKVVAQDANVTFRGVPDLHVQDDENHRYWIVSQLPPLTVLTVRLPYGYVTDRCFASAVHRRVVEALEQGATLTTVDAPRRKPTLYHHGTIVLHPSRNTLDDMVAVGCLHHVLNWHSVLNPTAQPDEEWHLGPGNSVEARMCPVCLYMDCPFCHPCFQRN